LRAAGFSLAGIEMTHKWQGRFAFNPASTLKEQLKTIAA
jgi:hypothetical protein